MRSEFCTENPIVFSIKTYPIIKSNFMANTLVKKNKGTPELNYIFEIKHNFYLLVNVYVYSFIITNFVYFVEIVFGSFFIIVSLVLLNKS